MTFPHLTLTPSDRLIGGFFVCLMAFGASVLFITVNNEVSEAVPLPGGTHVEGVIGTPRFVNPVLATSDTDRDLASLVFAGLMKARPDGTVEPHLAASYEVSDDGLSYTFHLKDNVYFHDGTPVTAEDVVFTVNAAKNPELKSPKRANWEGVETVALDKKTLQFSLRAPYALFVENTTLGILPKHLWESIAAEEFPFTALNIEPVGAGLYRVDSVKKNQSGVPVEYTLVASQSSDVRPYITHMLFKFFENEETLRTALNNGDVDAAHSTVGSDRSRLEEARAVYARVFAVFFNQNQQALFTDTTVRRALDESLDKKSIVDTILSGYGSPLSGPLPPQSVASPTEGESAEERQEHAQALLENAGWVRGDDGVYQKTVKKETTRLAFSLKTSNAPELKQAAELVAESWRALGAEVELQFFDLNDLNTEVLRPRKYDALLFGQVVGRELDLFAFWHSSQRNDPGLNVGLYANIETDQLLEKARSEFDTEERAASARAAADIIAEEVAAVFLYAPHFVYQHEPQLRGVTFGTLSTPSDRFAGVEDWYVAVERVWPLFITKN